MVSCPRRWCSCPRAGSPPRRSALAERRANRSIILAEPNDAGGWTLTGPPETQALTELLDPELADDKRERVREVIGKRQAEVLGGGLPADRVAAAAHVPLHLAEKELQSYASDASGLVARRLGGTVVLFSAGSGIAGDAGGQQMPFIQRIKALFTGKVDNRTKINLLSERRAELTLKRDREYEQMQVKEQEEGDLREQFKNNASTSTRKRITSQLVQVRKDLERRQQILGMLNQQINVINTHLHNLELVEQGTAAKLPTSEELAGDAAQAEEVLAQLQADNELAGTMGPTTTAGLTDEEQALYAELEQEATQAKEKEKEKPAAEKQTVQQKQPPAKIPDADIAEDEPAPKTPQRKQAEAG